MESSNKPGCHPTNINRRSFLKLLASGALYSLLPSRLFSLGLKGSGWPELGLKDLPWSIQDILNRVPAGILDGNGYFSLFSPETGEVENVPLFPTRWNIENSHPYNQLKKNLPWGIVLHWFGDKTNGQGDINFYMRGFDGIRKAGDYYTSTSAHFLVGEDPPVPGTEGALGIVQVQKPAPDGTPYQAAHIRSLDHDANENGDQYFIRALNQLSQSYPGVRPLLGDLYASPGVLAHMQTLAVETTGFDFDNPINYPGPQKIANVVSVVWAVMKRYDIPATNLMGHHELQLSKPDPGKKFLALIKFIIGIKALVDTDGTMVELVFGPFIDAMGDQHAAVVSYFKYLRGYLLLTTSPRGIFEWDAWSKYWHFFDWLTGKRQHLNGNYAFTAPIKGLTSTPGNSYLDPGNHDGIDIYPGGASPGGSNQVKRVRLIGAGTCLYLGQSRGFGDGLMAAFRHRLADGSEIISLYQHMDEIRTLLVGERYPGGHVIGMINTLKSAPHGYLHFSIAYGPSWEIALHKNPMTPLNAGPTWIRTYFMDPAEFLRSINPGIEAALENTHLRPK